MKNQSKHNMEDCQIVSCSLTSCLHIKVKALHLLLLVKPAKVGLDIPVLLSLAAGLMGSCSVKRKKIFELSAEHKPSTCCNMPLDCIPIHKRLNPHKYLQIENIFFLKTHFPENTLQYT